MTVDDLRKALLARGITPPDDDYDLGEPCDCNDHEDCCDGCNPWHSWIDKLYRP